MSTRPEKNEEFSREKNAHKHDTSNHRNFLEAESSLSSTSEKAVKVSSLVSPKYVAAEGINGRTETFSASTEVAGNVLTEKKKKAKQDRGCVATSSVTSSNEERTNLMTHNIGGNEASNIMTKLPNDIISTTNKTNEIGNDHKIDITDSDGEIYLSGSTPAISSTSWCKNLHKISVVTKNFSVAISEPSPVFTAIVRKCIFCSLCKKQDYINIFKSIERNRSSVAISNNKDKSSAFGNCYNEQDKAAEYTKYEEGEKKENNSLTRTLQTSDALNYQGNSFIRERDDLPPTGHNLKKERKINKNKYNIILKNIHLVAQPGEMLVIMGPSGSGKTTLLNALAGRLSKKGTILSGHLIFKGLPSGSTLKDCSTYIMQKDRLPEFLTVRELLEIFSILKMKDSKKTERKERVEEVLKLLNLSRCQHVPIGGVSKKCLSGGEQKRVSLALELLSNPSLLFVDEPTSGLDAALAFDVLKILMNIAKKGPRTVICTVHQPRSQLFSLFDKLLLLSQGEIVYQGKASECCNYFSKIGYTCPAMFNPADFILDLLTISGDPNNPGYDAEANVEQSEMTQNHFINSFPAVAALGQSGYSHSHSQSAHIHHRNQRHYNYSTLDRQKENGIKDLEINPLDNYNGNDYEVMTNICDKNKIADCRETSSWEKKRIETFDEMDDDSYCDDSRRTGKGIYDMYCDLNTLEHAINENSDQIISSDLQHHEEKRDFTVKRVLVDEREIRALAIKYKQSSECKIVNQRIEEIISVKDLQSALHSSLHSKLNRKKRAINHWFTEFAVLTKMHFLDMCRNPLTSIVQCSLNILLGLILGIFYWQIPALEKNVTTSRNIFGLLFFLSSQFFFAPMDALVLFAEDRELFNRDTANGNYTVFSYFLSKTITTLVFHHFPITLLMIISYWMCGLESEAGKFFVFLLVGQLSIFTSTSFLFTLSSLSPRISVAQASAPIIYIIFLLLGGFYLRDDDIPSWISWSKYASFIRYAYVSLSLNQFPADKYWGQFSNEYLLNVVGGIDTKAFGAHLSSSGFMWMNVFLLFICGLFFRITSFLSLKYCNRRIGLEA